MHLQEKCAGAKGRNNMENSFFALLFRQKYIKRWGLMRNTTDENLSEHSAETAFIAHALALIGNKKFGKSYDADAIAVAALYHDAAEIYTGDLPTPVKYYSEEMRKNYKQIEAAAEKILVSHLPEEFREVYSDIISGVSGEEKVLVKAAGGISGLEDAENFLKNGASRLGTSRVVKAVQGIEGKGY